MNGMIDIVSYSENENNTNDKLILTVKEGWNLISGLNHNSVILDNDIIVKDTLYKFNNKYINSKILEPGKGYWIKIKKDGKITLNITN